MSARLGSAAGASVANPRPTWRGWSPSAWRGSSADSKGRYACSIWPAATAGNLLGAINDALPRETRRRATLVGIENDETSFASLRARQQTFDGCQTDLIRGDFLEFFGDSKASRNICVRFFRR